MVQNFGLPMVDLPIFFTVFAKEEVNGEDKLQHLLSLEIWAALIWFGRIKTRH